METNNATDVLVGMGLAEPNVEKKVLAACEARMTEQGLDGVNLTFGGDDQVIVRQDDTVESLKKKLDVIHGQGDSLKPA